MICKLKKIVYIFNWLEDVENWSTTGRCNRMKRIENVAIPIFFELFQCKPIHNNSFEINESGT